VPASTPDIDIVILWVDGSDPSVVAEYSKAAAETPLEGRKAEGPSRHRDNGELLFVLRSIKAQLPWFRKIHIVTNGQRPRYVDFSRDDIRLVTHAAIFPVGVKTPSFNTFAIESCIHEIDGLSEYFLRFSDDFFIGRSASKADLLGEDGLGRTLVGECVFNGPQDYYYDALQAGAVRFWEKFNYLPLYNPLHAPQLRRRSVMRELVATWPEWFAKTRANRFRSADDVNSLFLYPYFSLFHGRKKDLELLWQERDAPGIRRVFRKGSGEALSAPQVHVGARNDWRARLAKIAAEPPLFFNVNDDMSLRPDPADLKYVGEKLVRLFPKPSPWETNPDAYPGYAREAARSAATSR
jgi:hypothetical protein